GFAKALEIQGVGYKAEPKPFGVQLVVGFSHPVPYHAPQGIKISVDNNVLVKIEGVDKELVGQVAAEIRAIRPHEPYKGKGFRSSKHIYAQIVDDARGVTLVGAADTSEGLQVDGKGKTAKSFGLGRLVAAKAKEKGITKVVFDRGGYQYHGRVKAVAEGARKGGLEL